MRLGNPGPMKRASRSDVLTRMILAVAAIASCDVGLAQDAPARPGGAPSDVRCGSYCLFVALDALGLAPDEFEALEGSLGPPDPRGYSMEELRRQAEQLGAETLAVKTSLENLARRKARESFCCIAFLDGESHYVVLSDTESGSVSVVDPPQSYELPAETLGALWSGEALLLSTEPLTPEADLGGGFGTVALVLLVVAGVGLVAGLLLLGRKRRA